MNYSETVHNHKYIKTIFMLLQVSFILFVYMYVSLPSCQKPKAGLGVLMLLGNKGD